MFDIVPHFGIKNKKDRQIVGIISCYNYLLALRLYYYFRLNTPHSDSEVRDYRDKTAQFLFDTFSITLAGNARMGNIVDTVDTDSTFSAIINNTRTRWSAWSQLDSILSTITNPHRPGALDIHAQDIADIVHTCPQWIDEELKIVQDLADPMNEYLRKVLSEEASGKSAELTFCDLIAIMSLHSLPILSAGATRERIRAIATFRIFTDTDTSFLALMSDLCTHNCTIDENMLLFGHKKNDPYPGDMSTEELKKTRREADEALETYAQSARNGHVTVPAPIALAGVGLDSPHPLIAFAKPSCDPDLPPYIYSLIGDFLAYCQKVFTQENVNIAHNGQWVHEVIGRLEKGVL